MSRFVSDKKIKLELGGEEWVEIKENLSFNEMEPIMARLDGKDDTAALKMAIPLLKVALVDWNLLDDGKQIPFSVDKIEKLNTVTVTELLPKILEQYFPEKKKIRCNKENIDV